MVRIDSNLAENYGHIFMKIFISREDELNESRVASTPSVVKDLIKLGYQVQVQSGAGAKASFSDLAYSEAGAEIVDDWSVSANADILLMVRLPSVSKLEILGSGQSIISFVWPSQNSSVLDFCAAKGINLIAMDCIPRISRAQKMDALSSMANIGGYRAVIEAANQFGRFFTGQITAAGKINPAKVMIIGAGVAGFAAIGAAKSLGAIVRAFDTRPEVKEQVESMDAEFLMLDFKEDGVGEGGYAKVMSDEFIKAEMELFARQAAEVDVIITTALIPGKPAPKLITKEMVSSMTNGSVIVDLAAEQGGNCELTVKDEIVVEEGVSIIGYTDLPSRLATQSSQLYGTNLRHLLTDMTPDSDGEIKFDMDDEVVRGATVVFKGKVIWPPPPPKIQDKASKTPKQPSNNKLEQTREVSDKRSNNWGQAIALGVGAGLLWLLGGVAPESFMAHFTVFVLACFVGYQVVWNVTPALHTPLMSVTNAISGIIVIGALLQISSTSSVTLILSGVAILIATINIAGGFLVTRRMLEMFRK